MTKSAAVAARGERAIFISDAVEQGALVVGASLLVAVCARVTVPLPFTPVPLTLQNFAVLLVGLALGPRRAFAAMVLYLIEGASGLPVFNPLGPGGIAQLLGPTGGYLMAYPFVAALAGAASGRSRNFVRILLASTAGEMLLFAFGIAWFSYLTRMPASRAVAFTLYPFFFAEVIKVMAASALAPRWHRFRRAPANS
jgi:biotin transport system substrate-specific component